MQGLGGALCRSFKARICRELHKFQVGSCDLIMLQEHHLDASKIRLMVICFVVIGGIIGFRYVDNPKIIVVYV